MDVLDLVEPADQVVFCALGPRSCSVCMWNAIETIREVQTELKSAPVAESIACLPYLFLEIVKCFSGHFSS